MTQVRPSLTDYGLKSVMEKGVNNTFEFFSLSDMSYMYNVTASNTYLNDLMNFNGLKTQYTFRESCNNAVATFAEVVPPTEEQQIKDQRVVYEFYKTDCGTSDFNKQNLNVTVKLHEWFAYLESLVSTEYSQDIEPSLEIFQGIDAFLQEYDVVTDSWTTIDNKQNFTAWYEFASEVDSANYKKINSKFVEFSTDGSFTQTDKAFQRFASPFSFIFDQSYVGNQYLEGKSAFLTFLAWEFGYLVNNNSFVTVSDLRDPSNYKTIVPAVRQGNERSDIYYLNEFRNFNTMDRNKSMANFIWNYVNVNGESLIEKFITQFKNNIEFNFKETSFGVYELPINFKLKTKIKTVDNFVGGNFSINFIYDTNFVIPFPDKDNVITVE
jgi:hypothetical protein